MKILWARSQKPEILKPWMESVLQLVSECKNLNELRERAFQHPDYRKGPAEWDLCCNREEVLDNWSGEDLNQGEVGLFFGNDNMDDPDYTTDPTILVAPSTPEEETEFLKNQ